MLSEALQRNSKHEARLFKRCWMFAQRFVPEMIVFSSLRSE
jgi:hypothetical protein